MKSKVERQSGEAEKAGRISGERLGSDTGLRTRFGS
jgi:hypothetical protein